MEVNVVPPPVPVAAAGPLRVELKLGNGQCHSKGCVEGECLKQPEQCQLEQNLWCILKRHYFDCRRGGVQLLLHCSRLSSH